MFQINSSEIKQVINRLLSSDIKANQIQIDTGLQRSLISKLRNGQVKLDNITFKKAMILYEYAKTHLKS